MLKITPINLSISRNEQYIILVVQIAFSSLVVSAQQVKKAESGIFLLKNGTIHTVTSGTFIGDILLKDGIIADIGTNLSEPQHSKVVDCTSKHIYPGMIDGGSRVGLSEVSSISVTNDFSELGDYIPHMKALTAVNPNAVAIPVTRINGVTTVFAKPSGGTFPGTGALIDLFGYSPEQMTTGAEHIVMNFPSTGRRGRWDRRTDDDIKKDADKALKNINDVWESVTQYHKMDSLAKAENQKWLNNNPQMEALLPVFRGQVPILIEVNSKGDIESALEWVADKKLKVVLTGVSEGWRLADKIAKAKIAVITGPVLAVPGRDNDRYDASYANAGKMSKAGVKVAIRTDGSENTRNLPFNAGFAAAYGLGIDEALKAVTIYPAEIFGVADKYGSLEKNKVANLFVSTGDPFETKTQIEHLFIKGWKIPMESRHTLLYDEFLERTPGVK
ncbi:MAG: amidohydrolase family protein [Saprospiraceae bacterium]|nr:amidohydrolase family protein [Saprospiraceae bacterium]